jgi:hypothetical protein
MVMVMMLGMGMRGSVVMPGGKRGAGKNHQEQGKSKNLLHGKNVPRFAGAR